MLVIQHVFYAMLTTGPGPERHLDSEPGETAKVDLYPLTFGRIELSGPGTEPVCCS